MCAAVVCVVAVRALLVHFVAPAAAAAVVVVVVDIEVGFAADMRWDTQCSAASAVYTVSLAPAVAAVVAAAAASFGYCTTAAADLEIQTPHLDSAFKIFTLLWNS